MRVLSYEEVLKVIKDGKIRFNNEDYLANSAVLTWIKHNPPSIPNKNIGDVFPNVGGMLVVIRPGQDKEIFLFQPGSPPDTGFNP